MQESKRRKHRETRASFFFCLHDAAPVTEVSGVNSNCNKSGLISPVMLLSPAWSRVYWLQHEKNGCNLDVFSTDKLAALASAGATWSVFDTHTRQADNACNDAIIVSLQVIHIFYIYMWTSWDEVAGPRLPRAMAILRSANNFHLAIR